MIICLRPDSYHHPDIEQITNSHTHKAIEILCNLSEEFADLLFANQEAGDKASDDDVVTD